MLNLYGNAMLNLYGSAMLNLYGSALQSDKTALVLCVLTASTKGPCALNSLLFGPVSEGPER